MALFDFAKKAIAVIPTQSKEPVGPPAPPAPVQSRESDFVGPPEPTQSFQPTPAPRKLPSGTMDYQKRKTGLSGFFQDVTEATGYQLTKSLLGVAASASDQLEQTTNERGIKVGNGLSSFFLDTAKKADIAHQEYDRKQEEVTSFGYRVGEDVVSQGSQLLFAVLSGGLAGSLFYGGQQFGDTYADARNKGSDTASATRSALATAAVTTLSERIGLKKLQSASGGVVKRILKGMASESIQENIENQTNNLIEKVSFDPDRVMFSLKEMGYTTLISSLLGGTATGGRYAVTSKADIEVENLVDQISNSVAKTGVNKQTAKERVVGWLAQMADGVKKAEEKIGNMNIGLGIKDVSGQSNQEDYQDVPVERDMSGELRPPKITNKQHEFLNIVGEDYQDVSDMQKNAKEQYKQILDQEVALLQEQGGKGVEQGFLIKNEKGDEVVGRQGRQSNNPEWYRKLFNAKGRSPSLTDLKNLAKERLTNGYQENGIDIEPNARFRTLESAIENIGQIKESGVLVDYNKTPEDYPSDRATINRVTNVSKPQTKVTVNEKSALKTQLRMEAKASTEGYKQGSREEKLANKTHNTVIRILDKANLRADIQSQKDVRQNIVDYTKEHLNREDQGMVLNILKNAKTLKDQEAALEYIDRAEEKIEGRGIVSEIKGIAKQMGKNEPGQSKVAADYRKNILSLIGGYNLTKPSEGTIAKLQSQKEAAEKYDIPPSVLERIERLDRKNISDLPLAELRQFKADLELLTELGRVKQRNVEGAYKTEKERKATEVYENKQAQKRDLAKPTLTKTGLTQKAGKAKKIKEWFQETAKTIFSPAKMADSMDGLQHDQGPVYKHIYEPVSNAEKQAQRWRMPYAERVDAIIKKYKLTEQQLNDAYFTLRENYDQKEQIESQVSKEHLDSIELNEGQQELIDLLNELTEDSFPMVEKVSRTLQNVIVNKEEGYAPMMTNKQFQRTGSGENNMPTIEEVLIQEVGTFMPKNKRKNVERGFAISRTGDTNKIIITNIADVIKQHSERVGRFIFAARPIRMAQEIASDPRFAKTYGDLNQELMRSWVEFMANGQRVANTNSIPEQVNRFIQGWILLSNVGTAGMQLTSIPMVVGQGVSHTKMIEGVFKQSEEIARQSSDYIARQSQTLDSYDQAQSGKLMKYGMWVIKTADLYTWRSNFTAAVLKWGEDNKTKLDLKKLPEEAILYGEKVAGKSQGASTMGESPLAFTQGTGLLNSRAANASIGMFHKFTLNLTGQLYQAAQYAIHKGEFKNLLLITYALVLTTVLGETARRGIDWLRAKAWGKSIDTWADFESNVELTLLSLGIPFSDYITSAIEYDQLGTPGINKIQNVWDKFSQAVKNPSEKNIRKAVGEILPGELAKQWKTATKDELDTLLYKKKEEGKEKMDEARKLDERLSKLPVEEAKRVFQKIKDNDPELAKKIQTAGKERKLGLTDKEKSIKQLNDKDGSQAQYLFDQLEDMNEEEQREQIEEWKEKKIITPEIWKQILSLKKQL